MGLLDFLKREDNKNANGKLQADIELFEKELFAVVPRYISKPGAAVDIKARHKETNEVIPFAVGFPEQFDPWRTVQSVADRRGILYELLDSQFMHQLQLWQIIERYNDDRYAERALEAASESRKASDENDVNFWNALARTNLILTRYDEAESNCLNATELDPDNIRTKRVHADVLHCMGATEKAHKMYNDILQTKLPADQPMNLPLQQLLGFDGDILNSPIYAADWLEADKLATDEAWEWANEEFYYSPHFRSRYANKLIKDNQQLKGFVKMLQITKEMPWFKESVINCYNLIDQLNLTREMVKEKIRLEGIIKQNGWSNDQ